MVVVEGCFTLIVNGRRIPVMAGEEYLIPKGLWHGGEPLAGTRTIHAFGGRRARRAHEKGSFGWKLAPVRPWLERCDEMPGDLICNSLEVF
jgi:hypothetical protein